MSVIGLDLNATRARAVHGAAGSLPAALALEDGVGDLPLAVSLEGRRPLVGRAGGVLRRRAPHLTCVDFLPYLGSNREWSAGSLRLTADQALSLTFEALAPAFGRSGHVFVVLPSYLEEAQRERALKLAEKAGWRLLGAVPAAAASAVAAQQHLPWGGLALVLDADGAALTWSAVTLTAEQARLADVLPLPRLSRTVWLAQLLDLAARRCVRLARRDPRESPDAEQALYEQLEQMLELGPDGDGSLGMNVQGPNWGQQVTLLSSELAAACAPLVERTLAGMQELLARTVRHGSVTSLLVGPGAANLPGLLPALQQHMRVQPQPTGKAGARRTALYVEGGDELAASRVQRLEAYAVARAAHELGARVRQGEWPLGNFDTAPLPLPEGEAIPLSESQAIGPARLEFEGRHLPLAEACFRLGRDPSCNLVFPTERFPTVSANHCLIVQTGDGYVLQDRSRHGTLVNERRVSGEVALHYGDAIRLGPGGPIVRFLGSQPGEHFITGG